MHSHGSFGTLASTAWTCRHKTLKGLFSVQWYLLRRQGCIKHDAHIWYIWSLKAFPYDFRRICFCQRLHLILINIKLVNINQFNNPVPLSVYIFIISNFTVCNWSFPMGTSSIRVGGAPFIHSYTVLFPLSANYNRISGMLVNSNFLSRDNSRQSMLTKDHLLRTTYKSQIQEAGIHPCLARMKRQCMR